MVGFALLLVLLNIYLIKGENATKDSLVIEISNGFIRGRKALIVHSQREYFAYEGIPYATPPLGDLRFRAPVPARNWSGILNATRDRGECTQLIVQGTEDCLFINAYTTSLHPPKLLPVMVWIYGGYFLVGDSNYTEFGPDYFLEEDVVVVTMNYRVSVFGFLCTEDLAAAGNWGLKDQILALKWVQKNIMAFGGDPSRVTLFGESAGSASVSYILQSPLSKGLFHQAIMESGTTLDLWALARNPRATAFKLGVSLGIVTANSTYLVQKLRQVDFRKIETNSILVDVGETVLTNPRDGLIFAPCAEPVHEGAVVVGRSHENLRKGQFNRVPVIIGFNSEEGIPFVEILERVKLYLLTYEFFPSRLIPIDMNINPLNKLAVALKIRTHYFGLRPILSNENLVQYVTDDQFTRPICEAVRLISRHVPVYFYRFSYIGRLGLDAGQQGRQYLGVGHGEDLNYLWRKTTNIRNPTEYDILTRRRLIRLWTNFAKTANPTPEPDPLLQNVTWISATPEVQAYLDVGSNLSMGSNLSKYSIPWWRELYAQYGNPPYDTY